MISNDLSNQLQQYMANRSTQATGNPRSQTVSSAIDRLKQKQDAIYGRNTEETEAEEEAKKTNENLTAVERREKELKDILDKINAEESQRNPAKVTQPATTEQDIMDMLDISGQDGLISFLNEMPLFNEFKTSLMAAFERMDSASSGFISAQYELNYSCMQYVANEAGEFEYKETTLNIKLDLNYVKAAAGGSTGRELADAIGKSDDFPSLLESLTNAANKNKAASTDPKSFLTSLQDYFSPENTAGRIVDFATAFFPLSSAYKKMGDTEEARAEFGEMMRKAVQKGFDQAMGRLGKVPKNVQDGIDKTHELTMLGIDDFIKNGLNSSKQEQGIYSALEQFSMSFEMSYSQKTVSVSGYNSQGQVTQPSTPSQFEAEV